MNQKSICKLLACFVLVAAFKISAQGTAFMYQGRLNDGGAPANGAYDLRFALFDAVTNGNAIGVAQTNLAVPVSSGVFTTNIDFGAVFTGTNYWLSVGVRTNGNTGTFTLLWPRQPLLPVPYAVFATSASNLLGTLAASKIAGTLSDARLSTNVSLLNAGQVFSGSNTFTNGANTFYGTYFGNGVNLTNLNASMLATGTVADARLSANVALLDHNQTFSGVNNMTNVSNTFSGSFTGNGPGLTNLNGSQISSGTVADARLSVNVALLDHIQTFYGTNTFTGPVTSTASNNFTGINTFGNGGNSFTGSFFGNGLVGWVQVTGTSQSAVRDHGYMMSSAAQAIVTLPLSATLTNGDIVRVSGAGGGGWLVTNNSGQSIIGNFASYRNATLVTAPPSAADFKSVAVAADGIHMFAVGNFNGVQASTDSGQTFSQVGIISGFWNSVACSANGKKVYIASNTGGIQVSSDGGLNWSSVAGAGTWNGISCSADGSRLFTGNVACSGGGNYVATFTSSTISVSTNAGTNWVSIPVPTTGLSCLGASSDCTRLVAGVNNGLLYASANQGGTWAAITNTNQAWAGLDMTADGSRFAGAVGTSGSIGGDIFHFHTIAQPNTTSTTAIGGGQGSAVELQYLGNNQFMPVSSTGLIWAN